MTKLKRLSAAHKPFFVILPALLLYEWVIACKCALW